MPAVVLNLRMARSRLGGDDGLLREVLQMFLEDSPQLVAAVEASVALSEITSLRVAAHTLKGSVGMAGGQRAYDVIYAVEQHCKAGDLEAALTLWPTYVSEHAQLIAAIEDYLRAA